MADKLKLPGDGEMRFLEASITKRAANDDSESPTFEVAVSSEFEVVRSFYGMKWREVLDHSAESIDLGRFTSGRAAVLEEHRGAPIGVIDSVTLGKDRVLRANIRFSRSQRGREVQQDVEDGIRSNISVGLLPREATLVEQNEEKGDLWRYTSWEPVELSVVGIPADPTVGVGRALGEGNYPPVIIKDGRAVKEEGSMLITRKLNGGTGGGEAAPVVAAAAAVAPAAPVITAGITSPSVRELADLATANGVTDSLPDWLQRGLTPGEAALDILRQKKTRGVATAATDMGMPERDMRKYEYRKAILGSALMAEGKPWTGLEAEVHQEMERNIPALIERRGGALVPMQLVGDSIQKRTLASNAGTKGAETVFESQGELIDLFRNRTAILKSGARMLTGLTGPIAFPKQTGAMTAYWVGENPGVDVTDSDVALGLALLTPRTLQASTAYARQLLVQSGIDVESMVRDELGTIHSIAMDRAGIHGKGAAGEPTGIYKAIGVSSSAIGGAMTYAKLLTMQGKVADANADVENMAWIFTTTMATNLRGVLEFSAAGSQAVWQGTYFNGQVAGYKATATNQMSKVMTGSEDTGGSEYGVVFGNFNDIIIGGFGGLELVVDPYRLKKQGVIEVTSFQMCDVLVRRGESFCKATGATS